LQGTPSWWPYIEFGCYKLVNNAADENALYAELDAYHAQCSKLIVVVLDTAATKKVVTSVAILSVLKIAELQSQARLANLIHRKI
jgi:hypothetical protein